MSGMLKCGGVVFLDCLLAYIHTQGGSATLFSAFVCTSVAQGSLSWPSYPTYTAIFTLFPISHILPRTQPNANPTTLTNSPIPQISPLITSLINIILLPFQHSHRPQPPSLSQPNYADLSVPAYTHPAYKNPPADTILRAYVYQGLTYIHPDRLTYARVG